MDLNNIPEAATPATAATKPLRIVRLPTLDTDNGGLIDNGPDELIPFDGGEALPESQGEDFPLPISDAEREALEREGYELDEQERAAEEFMERQGRERALKMIAEAEQAERDMYHSRECPLPECGAIARVPKGQDQGDVLGLGMSMTCAVELEQLLTSHLEEHTLGDWIAALKYYQERPAPMQTFVTPVVEAGIIPGPSKRSPEREAAVRALDARLGGVTAPMNPQAVAEHDDALRELRRRRRAEKPPEPYDLTPKWSQDMESGVVGIKR